MAASKLPLLPMVSAPSRSERADAARNRSAILDAAQALLLESAPECITMEGVAEAAGVGKGTVFRRFGDRGSLFFALLGESERELQEAILRGPPPLGPGPSPRERLVAFGTALLRHIELHGDLLLAGAPRLSGRLGHPVHLVYRRHVSLLLEAAGDPQPDLRADALLGGLTPELVRHQRRVLDIPLAELERSWERLVLDLVD